MYAFDVGQQFGWIGPALAGAGLVHLFRTDKAAFWLFVTIYAVNVAFALTYNVGDTHVFLLPAHVVMAIVAAAGIVAVGSTVRRVGAVPVLAALVAVAAAFRIYDNFPALDRSGDTRPSEVLSALARGLDDQHSVLLTDMNWQVENGLTYFARRIRPDVVYAAMPHVLPYAPTLIEDNLAIGREVVLTDRAAASLTSAHGPMWTIDVDRRVPTPTLAEMARSIPAGSRYVVCLLRPTRETPLDGDDVAEAVRVLTSGTAIPTDRFDFLVVGGLAGSPPALVEGRDRPFRRRVELGGVPVDVRMESWLSFDTIRRMGFGHVVAARRHALIVERGASLVAFDETGAPLIRGYRSSIFGLQGRQVVRGTANERASKSR
jgi:hypothetical protein